MMETATDETATLVRRLARPHASGGMVIERSVILAEGANSAAILNWISEHDGVADFTVPSTRSQGLHSPSAIAPTSATPAPRFVLPARAFQPAGSS
jgi:NaMN:DMB phosphoribosyltransferase